ncbi:HD domain-containing protein [Weeksella sp. HMSC059D05]|uniref:HD domain-containing protein n=1 Tax=Weeksella sp. HMSC059D05 TaxID=1715139 RepID=UPI0009F27621|nr:HD domain-containing protein [Weeksella sp. HMSC059D05]
MDSSKTNKFKIVNDPVHGFIRLPNDLVFDVIQHPYFQRLRRISQTGLTQMVYPGARHSRLHHALGCLYLMQNAVATLRAKNVPISADEETGVYLAILLHDLGHGPFSHSLEHSIIEDTKHEEISLVLMQELNRVFNGSLTTAIRIFKGEYPKKFLKQLVSSQLDIDRLDYLKRDSFYTGVVEGNINPDRIISMMTVHENELVYEAKGLYSIEKFLMARMFMYWQVYMHKTSFTAEQILIQTLRRAKDLVRRGEKLFATSAMTYFLEHQKTNFAENPHAIAMFTQLDDHDVMSSIKEWTNHSDEILRILCLMLVDRKLPKAIVMNQPIQRAYLDREQKRIEDKFGVEDASYLMGYNTLDVLPYDPYISPIKIIDKNGSMKEITQVEHQLVSLYLSRESKRYHFYSVS